MQAGILYQDRDMRAGEAAEPRLRPGEVLIAPGYTGICGTDLHIFRGEFHDRVAFPAILGHEFGGIVQEVAPDVTNFRPGDRVVVDPILSCGHCPACLTGHLNACTTLKLLGVDLNGGFGQLVAAPVSHVYALPDNVPLAHAPMVEMYGLGHHVLGRGGVQPGETVAILGAGRLGLAVLDVLCHSVAPSLALVADVQPFRLDVARKLGAAQTINLMEADPVAAALAMTDGMGVDCVIECVGHYHEIEGREAPLAQAVKMIRNGGRIVTAGLGEQLSPVHFKTLVLKEGQIIGSRVTLGEFPRAIRMLAAGLLHPDLLVTHQAPLAEIGGAFHQVDSEDPCTIKVVVQVN
jgi:L-gulonate 5-dehydrogenase